MPAIRRPGSRLVGVVGAGLRSWKLGAGLRSWKPGGLQQIAVLEMG